MPKLKTKIGKYLCYMLRHDEDFVLDSEGWANISRISGRIKGRFNELKDKEDTEIINIIMDIVNNDDKKRYSTKVSSDIVWVRCNYGHSNRNIDIEYVNSAPPVFLYHGTSKENYEKIIASGKIDMMSRNNIHLSEDIKSAIRVGKRHGDPIVIVLNAYDMYLNGINFHKVQNNTWLVDDPIDMCYENRVINTETCNLLLNNNEEKFNKLNLDFINTINCDAIMEKLSNHGSVLTVEDLSVIFNELVNNGKGNYKMCICGSEGYYLYIINDENNKVVSIDTSPNEFEEYFNDVD